MLLWIKWFFPCACQHAHLSHHCTPKSLSMYSVDRIVTFQWVIWCLWPDSKTQNLIHHLNWSSCKDRTSTTRTTEWLGGSSPSGGKRVSWGTTKATLQWWWGYFPMQPSSSCPMSSTRDSWDLTSVARPTPANSWQGPWLALLLSPLPTHWMLCEHGWPTKSTRRDIAVYATLSPH